MSARTLWADRDGGRFYLIPADAVLVPGKVRLQTLTGRSQDVDPDAVAPYLVDEATARARAAEQVAAIGQGVKRVLAASAGALGRVPQAAAAPAADPLDSSSEAESAAQKRARVVADLERTFETILGTVRDVAADPVALQSRMDALATRVRADHPDAARELEALPETLRELVADPKLFAAMDDATARLRAATEAMRASTAQRAARSGGAGGGTGGDA
jgi:hypothetical protein